MSIKQIFSYAFYTRCVCALCDEEADIGDDLLCKECRKTLFLLPNGGVLPAPYPLDGLCAGLPYDEITHEPLKALKYHEQTHFTKLFAHYITLPEEWEIDCIAPVPLHPIKQFLRGYNQSEYLAAELGERHGLPVSADLICRTRYTRTQTRLSAAQRAKNVAGAFVASGRAKGLSVLLVDDVTTTHATLAACAKALKQAGAKHVYAACACAAGVRGERPPADAD